MDATARARLAHRLARKPPGPEMLGAILLARGAISATDLAQAQIAQRRNDSDLADVLLARGLLPELDLLAALADCHGLGLSDLGQRPLATGLGACLPARLSLALEAVPTEQMGDLVILATSRPANIAAIRAALPHGLRAIVTLAPRDRITAAQIAIYGEGLARLAERQAPQSCSCRNWRSATALRWLLLIAACFALSARFAPVFVTAFLCGLALLIFSGNIALKIAAFAAARRGAIAMALRPESTAPLLRQPVVSLLVPLYREQDIAATLVTHLSRLDYPPERLDVLLITEADDATTHRALNAAHLPPAWRVLTVPPGSPRTKPRALNFALSFARGEIVGVYDAEDRPEPDQITKIARRFAESPPEVACLQGRLDYFNARHNLMSRLFALEYAGWFRVMLPGVQHLGLVVPLGGTTQFLRRDVLVEVGGWDAHNVTEDAELGLRLVRRGYRTEILDSTTYEEANAAVLPWIRQRARWQKGYLMTWAMAMRAPRSLWRDLGPMRFFALQVQLLGAVAGFLAAPLVWSLMVKPFGHAHPLDALVSPTGYGVLATAFVASSVLSIAVAVQATQARHLRHLRPWILVAEVYFLLATLSAWKAVVDMLWQPFQWDKTAHGNFGGTSANADLSPRPSGPLPSGARRKRWTGDP
ncbi:glycosyltransferase [Roseicyclus marinus]|uniref:glycosyltransferase n=1 Tax=Roseicyclus marinus TaxID=2161673 RepID=UPI00240FFF14|nr:glycosyltransferase [Roseicyclus marinus]MDG3040556.1 glycosyltransferase [Roseicyclus marinus]